MGVRGGGRGPALAPPRAIRADDDTEPFECGRSVLDEWLRKRALANDQSGASRTYVVTAGGHVVAYYALAVGAVELAAAPGRVRRNMPEPIPVMILARLAVDRRHQGHGIGRGLVRDALLRTLRAAEIAGIRALLVHALDEDAARFYERCGFARSPVSRLTLMVTLQDAAAALV